MVDAPREPAGRKDPAPSWQQLLIAFRWPLALIGLALVALLFYRETLQRVDAAGSAVGGLARTAADAVEAAASNLLTGNITETFVSSLPQSRATSHLELAAAEITETFTRTDERRILGDLFSLGTVVSEIRVPVTYRYHLRLDDPWQVEISGAACIVHAPPIRPSLPPAIHMDRLTRRVDADWLRFDSEEQMARLEKSLTPTLNRFAQDALHQRLVREDCRRAVEKFVRAWLLDQEAGEAGHVRYIKVIFPDEVDPGQGPERPPGRRVILE